MSVSCANFNQVEFRKKSIIALHGFLGQPADWDFLNQLLPEYEILKPSLYRKTNLSLQQWAQCFDRDFDCSDTPILLGYSLGGRLALHALRENPKRWKAVVCLSTHPGLVRIQERAERIRADEGWAERFLQEPWDSLISSWNSQKIFEHSKKTTKTPSHFSRELLANILTMWSLGHQEPFFADLEKIDVPILWLTGQNDEKFTELGKKIIFKNKFSKHRIIAGAGHRIHCDQPELCCHLIKEFLTKLEASYELYNTCRNMANH